LTRVPGLWPRTIFMPTFKLIGDPGGSVGGPGGSQGVRKRVETEWTKEGGRKYEWRERKRKERKRGREGEMADTLPSISVYLFII